MVRHQLAGPVRATADRAHQRLVLRAAQPRARRHLRHAQHHQLHPRRPVHAGRLHGVLPAAICRDRLLVGDRHRAARGRDHRHHHRAAVPAMALQARPSLRPAADLRSRAHYRGHLPQFLRLVGPALYRAAGAARRAEPRLHVPAELSRLGGGLLARGLPDHLVRDRAHQARLLPARRDRESRRWCAPSASTCRA